ncbi:hypothetical protein RND81_05G271000 [Saponaria officinalis]|uniref:Uncharacterized protein n=1 Tax=Saponaria officinalis TaxID=3572 RepID=A0AAW1L3Z6_SAPOF
MLINKNVDDLKQKLHYVTYELEITRKQTNEEIMKNHDHIKKLLLMLQATCKERDEAISQLKKLQQILAFNNKTLNFDQMISTSVPFSPDSPLLSNFPAKTNSSLTESNSFSIETNNIMSSQPKTHSHVSSPPVVDSFPFTTTTTAVSSPVTNNNICYNTNSVDRATLIIENLAKGRPLPPQGKLLQAVVKAGPLLQALMVSGSLPRWRNPPGVVTQQIPPVQLKGSIGACSTSVSRNNNNSNSNNNNEAVKGLCSTTYYGEMNGGSMGICPNSMLDFGGESLGSSCLVGGRMMPSGVSFDYPTPKRQRLL